MRSSRFNATEARDARYARLEEQRGGLAGAITPETASYFSTERNGAFLSTVNLEGQSCVQHRSGPAGIVNVLDPHTLAFADFTGNHQYIRPCNSENDRVFLLLMNCAERERVKIWGGAKAVTDDPELLRTLVDPAYDARIEQSDRHERERLGCRLPAAHTSIARRGASAKG